MTLLVAASRRDSDNDSDIEDRSPLDRDRDIEAQHEKTEASQKKALIKKKQDSHQSKSWFGRSVKVVETRLQCPAISCACTTGILTLILSIGAIIAFVYADSSTGAASGTTTYTLSNRTIAYIIGGVAAGCAFFTALNCFTHLFSCCTIGRYIPRRAFEDNIGELHFENERLTVTADQLKSERDRWQELAKSQQDYVGIQKKLTNNLREEFAQQDQKLSQVHLQLDQNVAELERAKEAIKIFEREIAKTNQILNQLAGSNRQFGEQLKALGVTTHGMEEQEVEWNKDAQVIAGENDEFAQHNQNLQNLGQRLAQQLNMMELFRNAIAQHSDRITKASVVLDESDDKFIAAHQALRETVVQREQQLQEMHRVHDQLKQSLVAAFERIIAALDEFKGRSEIDEPVSALRQILGSLSAGPSEASSS